MKSFPHHTIDHLKIRQRLLGLIVLTGLVIIWIGRAVPWASAAGFLIFILVSYGILVSIAMIHRKRQEMKLPPVVNESYHPKVSILVPAHNEEAVIAQTVHQLMALDYPDYEVWVIDDRSTDNTPRVLQQLQQSYAHDANNTNRHFYYDVRTVGSTPGKSAVLNDVFPKTTGDVIAVFDSDAVVPPDFLTNLVPFLKGDRVGGVQARKWITNAGQNWLTLAQHFEYAMDAYFQAGRDTIRGAVEFRGNGQLVKREALEAVGGWNEESVTDDLDLSTRFHIAGWDIRFAHKVLVGEEGIPQLMPLIKQRRRWAEGALTRYLEYLKAVIISDTIAMRVKIDLVAYIVEFLFPLWVLSDYTYLLYHWLFDEPHRLHLLTSLVMLPALGLFFYSTLIIAVIRFLRTGPFQTLAGVTLTSIYLVMIWVPVVMWVTIKILFQKERCLEWGKTQHHGFDANYPELDKA